MGFGELRVGEHMAIQGEGCTQSMEASGPFLTPCFVYLFYLAVPAYPFIINQSSST